MKSNVMETMVVRPVLELMQEHDSRILSDSAVTQIMGIIAQESDFGRYNSQLLDGPALGICQIERATIKDTMRYVKNKPALMEVALSCFEPERIQANQNFLEGDEAWFFLAETSWYFSVFLARVKLWMVPAPLPGDPTDLNAHAGYYKKHYNTLLGKATTDEWIEKYKYYVLEER